MDKKEIKNKFKNRFKEQITICSTGDFIKKMLDKYQEDQQTELEDKEGEK